MSIVGMRELSDLIEDLALNYTVWFYSKDRNYDPDQINRLEELTRSMAKDGPGFESALIERDLGMMVFKYDSKTVVFAAGKQVVLQKRLPLGAEI